jgi:uncharacterized repeat protein (TIGR03806 family)
MSFARNPHASRRWRLLVAAAACLLALAGCSRAPRGVQFHAQGNPAHLSDWNVVFAKGERLELNSGVVAYELNTPLFSDYAHKLRTVWMPAGTSARYDAKHAFEFPVGTVISKTFYYPVDPAARATDVVLRSDASPAEYAGQGLALERVRLVETRLLVRRQEGWVAFPYVWNVEQTDAELARAGDEFPLHLQAADGKRTDFTYVVPNSNQCAGCHGPDNKANRIEPIGLKARHLNRDHRYEDGVDNQLLHFARIGYLSGAPAPAKAPRNADWQDASLPLERRARAYLDINCGHCHNGRGPANTSGLWLDAEVTENLRLGVCKPPVAAGQGTGDHIFDIVPGKPAESILSYRLGSTDPGAMMPELGRGTQHAEGLALINAWIAAMPGDCSTGTTATTTFH